MKKLMFFVLSLKMGGSEKACVRMANALCGMYEVTVCTLFGGGELTQELHESIRVKSLLPGFIRGVARGVKMLPPEIAYKICVRGSYDIEIAVGDGIEAHIISGSKNTQKFCWVHMDMRFHGDEKNAKTDKRYSSFKKIICVSKTAEKGFLQKYGFGEKLAVAFTPVDGGNITAMSCQGESELPENAFVTVGRLEKVKGYERIIEAAALVKDSGFRLYIYGDGTQKQSLQQKIDDYSLNDSVFLMGQTENPYPMIKAAKALICCSYNESFGFTLVEAMLLKTPVLATRCGGAEEIINSAQVGLLCENSVRGLADGITEILNGETETDTECAYERAKNFCTDKCVAVFSDIINS